MAHIVTIRILVDENEESAITDGINEILRDAQKGVPNGEFQNWVLDWKYESIEPVNESLNDSIANETYAEGEAFDDWVIFSRVEAIAQDGAGFWSNEYGWTTLDLATKFEGASVRSLPLSAGMDAVWMLAPYQMNYHRLMLVENAEDTEPEQAPIVFECFAEHYDHAVEQAHNAYPGGRIHGQL